jgi:hypothetical protein
LTFCEFVIVLIPKLLLQGDTLDYLGIPGLRIAGSQGVLVIAICQALLMVLIFFLLYFVLVFGTELCFINQMKYHRKKSAIYPNSIGKSVIKNDEKKDVSMHYEFSS